MSRKLGFPLLLPTCTLVNKDDPMSRSVLCIQTNNTIYNEKRPKMADDCLSQEPQEMAELFAEIPEP